MEPLVQKHEFIEGWCKHCGAKEQNTLQTCLQRAISINDMAPEPMRRTYASEDWSAIHTRIGELETEKKAALNVTSNC
jgi:hypothetical protein